MYCSLLWLTLHIRVEISISHLFIPAILAHVGVRYAIVFNFFSPGRCFKLFFVYCLYFKNHLNLTSFLFKSKFLSLQICNSAHVLSHCYDYYNYFSFYLLWLFLHVLLLFFIFIVLWCQEINIIASIVIFINFLISFSFLFSLFLLLLLLLLLLWFCFFLFTSDWTISFSHMKRVRLVVFFFFFFIEVKL